MSLQSDLELCLNYAEALETKRDQRQQAQNNIIFLQNERERLKGKLRVCTILLVLSAIGILFFSFLMINILSSNVSDAAEVIPPFLTFLIILVIVFLVSLFKCIRTKKEYEEYKRNAPSFIQRYTQEAEDCECELIFLIREIEIERLLDIVPVDYFSVAAIEFCLTQVRKRLANTATEAFRQLDAEIKRLEQMAYLEELNNAQLEQLSGIKKAIDLNTLVILTEQNKNYS